MSALFCVASRGSILWEAMRPTWVEISRSALRHNYRLLRDRAGASGAGLLCVVKADAYGHGLGICGQVLAEEGAGWLGVTSVEEGVRLREALAQVESLHLAKNKEGVIPTEHAAQQGVIPTGASVGRGVEEPAVAFDSAVASDSAFAVASEIGPRFSADKNTGKNGGALAPGANPRI